MVADKTARAIGPSRLSRWPTSTPSTKYRVENGRARPTRRLTIITANPPASMAGLGRSIRMASGSAFQSGSDGPDFFFGSAGAVPAIGFGGGLLKGTPHTFWGAFEKNQ